MKKVCVIGHFGFGKNMLNGQTIKTKNVTDELARQLGADQITKIDTHGGLKVLPIILVQMVRAFMQCENIIILPAHNGIKIFVPMCVWLNRVYCRKLHYIVIGGWILSYLEKNQRLEELLKHFNGIYVETNTMKKALNRSGFNNVYIVPNFKDIKIIGKNEFPKEYKQPYKLCVFSRVMKEKGIEEAVNAVNEINRKHGQVVYTLDIYGQIDSEQVTWFENLEKNFTKSVRYCGAVSSSESVSVLKDYYLLVFPTKFYTEGIPGTIIDAYSAGVPVVSAKWESFSDIVLEGITGFGFEFNNYIGFVELLESLIDTSSVINMKQKCIDEAKKYKGSNAIRSLINNF